MDIQLSKLGLGVLSFTSVLAIYRSWGDDAASVALALLADAALLLLFLCLRLLDKQDVGRGRDASATKAAVWALTALLTAMVASGAAPIMPLLAVGALVSICLRDVDQVIRAGDGGGRVANMDAQYCALAKVGLAVLTCDAALDAYHNTRRDDDPGSAAALVLASYAVLVVLTGFFVRAVARAHAGDGDGDGQHGQG